MNLTDCGEEGFDWPYYQSPTDRLRVELIQAENHYFQDRYNIMPVMVFLSIDSCDPRLQLTIITAMHIPQPEHPSNENQSNLRAIIR
jgi:hypothetical protein